jgi:signal transduction histidine kinase
MGLRLRLVLVLVASLTAVVGLYGYVRVRQEKQQRLEDNGKSVALAAKALQVAVEQVLRDSNGADVQRLLAAVVADQDEVDRIRLFDRQLNPTAVSNRLGLGDAVPAEALRQVMATGQAEPTYREREGKLVLYYLAPIRDARGETIAAMEVVQLASTVQARVRAAQREIWIRLAVLGTSVALVTGVMLQRQVIQPLSALLQGIVRIGRGQPGPPLSVDRGDEFGRVAIAFNEMAEHLESARRHLVAETQRTLDLERQLRHAETLAVAGKLATAIAHEVGTPLNIISGRAEYVLRDLAADDPRRAEMAGIVEQIDRISGIIRSTLDAVRPQKPDLRPVDLRTVTERSLPLMRHAATRAVVRLTAELPEDLPPIRADVQQLQQVVINLLVNAIEAAGAGGTVTLRAEPARRDDETGVALIIADSGPGIPSEHLADVFKPFYTTKPRGQGTGLGLAICRDIIRDHHGRIELESPSTGGTRCVVWVPTSSEYDG